jgi:hypothetical protein
MGPMIPYVVRQGDYLTGIARRRGFDAQEVWQHPTNAALRERRPNPEVLAAGDILHVPETPAPGHRVTMGTTNRFSGRLPSVVLALSLSGSDGRPQANKRVWVDGEEAGSTDGDGRIQLRAQATRPSVMLRVEGSADDYLLSIAHLDPIDTDAGVRQRLANLGFLPEDSASVTEQEHTEALRSFQRQMGLDATGAPDAQTTRRLVSEHGS